MSSAGKISLAFDGIAILVAAFFYLKYTYGRAVYAFFHKEPKVKGPTFLSEAYRSLKDKVCVPIRFKGIKEPYEGFYDGH